MSVRPAQSPRVAAFDGVRGVAITLVVLHHAYPASGFRGEVGVDIFFVLSGYLITGLLLREHAHLGRVSFRRFYVRRLFRLYPALIVMLLLFLPIGGAIAPSIGQYLVDCFEAATYTVNLVQTWSSGDAGPMAHLWSLAEEEQFYLVWPPILSFLLWRRLSSRSIATWLIAASVASFVFFVEGKGGPHVVGRNPLARSGGLALGATVAILVDCAVLRTVRRSVLWPSMTLLVAVVLLGSTGALPRPLVVPLATVTVVPVVGHLATAGTGDWLSTLLSARALAWLGGISYSLYLWHYPFFYLLFVRLHWSSNYVFLLGIPAAVIIATASRRWVERPMLRLRERVTGSDPRPHHSVPPSQPAPKSF